MISSMKYKNAVTESSKCGHGSRERMAGENPYTVCFEAVPEQQFPTDSFS